MNTHRPTVVPAVILAGAIALLTLAGCKHGYSSGDETSSGAGAATELLAPSPDDVSLDLARGRSLFPLAVGNRWDYHIRLVNVITTDAGPQPPVIEEQALVDEITGTQTTAGIDYFLQSEFDLGGTPGSGSVFKVRGSRLGFFSRDPDPTLEQSDATAPAVDHEAQALAAAVDRAVADPAQRPAFQRAAAEAAAKLATVRRMLGTRRPQAGAAPGEITLLSYPLFPGKRWIVRDEPRFARIVIGRDRVNLALGTLPAWKIRGTAELFGPEDRVFFWYSNLGLLRLRFHGVSNATDATGNVIGTVATDEVQSLVDVHLVRPGASLVAGGGEQE